MSYNPLKEGYLVDYIWEHDNDKVIQGDTESLNYRNPTPLTINCEQGPDQLPARQRAAASPPIPKQRQPRPNKALRLVEVPYF